VTPRFELPWRGLGGIGVSVAAATSRGHYDASVDRVVSVDIGFNGYYVARLI
jgi:hypothetical protein